MITIQEEIKTIVNNALAASPIGEKSVAMRALIDWRISGNFRVGDEPIISSAILELAASIKTEKPKSNNRAQIATRILASIVANKGASIHAANKDVEFAIYYADKLIEELGK